VTVSELHSDRPSASGEPRVLVRVYALTDVGHTREHNEDTFLVADLESGEPIHFEGMTREMPAQAHGMLFLVADGMGGAASGELASSMAGTEVLSVLRERWRGHQQPSPEEFATVLRDATVLANSRIHGFARENPEHRGMGTTATIAGLLGDTIYVAQVGDSRAYMIRDGVARQLTKDQSLMQRLVEAGELTPEQAEASERRNIILQALGPESHVTIDLTHQQVRRGDTLILCSDGLSGLVRAEEIARIASAAGDTRSICQRLVNRANELGGPDNITVIAATFDGEALGHFGANDAVGYNTYPLAGTLNHDTAEEPVPSPMLKSRLRSDPTQEYSIPAPTASALEEEFARARAAEDARVLGAPEEIVEERRRKVEPLFLILALIATVAGLWFLVSLFRE
jgi:protein phosphatase